MDPLLAKVKEGAARDLGGSRSKGRRPRGVRRVLLLSEAAQGELRGRPRSSQGVLPLDHVVATTLEIYQELVAWSSSRSTSSTRGTSRCACSASSMWRRSRSKGSSTSTCIPATGARACRHLSSTEKMGRSSSCGLYVMQFYQLPRRTVSHVTTPLELCTFFHEFGHIMHGLCAAGDGNSTTLAKCPRDFVEAPSQMLENWCWTVEGLKRLSKHHETGATLPRDLLDKMLAAKNVNVGLNMARQIYLSTFVNLDIHGTNPPTTAEGLQALVDRLRPEISLIENPAGANMLRCSVTS